jgi:2-polyprenyl-6-methoxyphenol hydroxylase-like FAD-dependent oxidoreductase
MIGGTTQKLFRDAFGQDDLFHNLPAISRRIVAWGPDSEPRELPHSAVIVNEQDLLDKLRPSVGAGHTVHQADWSIIASRPLPDACVERHFGSRTARAVPVRLCETADPSACWVESLEDGWLFLIPGEQATGWLLAVGDVDEARLGGRLVSSQIAEIPGGHQEFAAHPRISWPLCGPGWLACGTAALAFDPLCGDGSGQAVREAILAAAVLRRIQRGRDRDELLDHYRSRLLGGFKRHLEACEGFYRTGGSTTWWQTQLQEIRAGLEWCASELGCGVSAQYQLRGFDLHRL